MTISKRQKRTAKKLILPLLAVGVMTVMMYLGRPSAPRPAHHGTPGTAARVPHDLRMR